MSAITNSLECALLLLVSQPQLHNDGNITQLVTVDGFDALLIFCARRRRRRFFSKIHSFSSL